MKDLNKRERDAIDAVARHVSATWEQESTGASFVVAGRRVAVDIATLKRRGADQQVASKPRLRFDKVVTRVMQRLQASLGNSVPDGMTVLLTIAAPIRMPSETAASLEERIKARLARRSPGRDEKTTVHGNRVLVGLVRSKSEGAPRLIGFVHNPDTDPLLLLNMARELLELATTEVGRRIPRSTGERWLVVMSARSSSSLDAYRYIYSQLRTGAGFKKTLMVFGDGQVGILAG